MLRLSDGGQVALDWVVRGAGAGEARAVLLVLPGLTGSADADYVRSLAAAAAALQARCVVFNNRGLGGLPLTVSVCPHSPRPPLPALTSRLRRRRACTAP